MNYASLILVCTFMTPDVRSGCAPWLSLTPTQQQAIASELIEI
ncbi:MAG: hypothetical protein PUP92_24675 [Rhizonema sp. PD38]|nr:hypothetical protein [Rhizonema sp. PD38]